MLIPLDDGTVCERTLVRRPTARAAGRNISGAEHGARLPSRLVFTGSLVGIYTAPEAGAPLTPSSEVSAVAGSGLGGDRYADQTGHYSARGGEGREVTLIEREVIAAANDEYELALAEHEPRRTS